MVIRMTFGFGVKANALDVNRRAISLRRGRESDIRFESNIH